MSGEHLAGKNVRIPMQDYRSLHEAAVICDTLVNTHTETAFDQLYY